VSARASKAPASTPRPKALPRGKVPRKDPYQAFLATKAVAASPAGFRVELDTINPKLFAHQRAVVAWALGMGRAAVFADCGLGKSGISLEWARHVAARTGKPVLILAPLTVAAQFVEEGEKFGVPCRYVREQSEVTEPGVYTTNYDRLDKIDAAAFGGVVLDESSVLKNFSGTTKRKLVAMWAGTPYRLCGTATPAPNDHQELGNHSEFLGVMQSHSMLARWFVNDTMQAGIWRLKGHAGPDFWRWVTTWAVCLGKPSDLGPEYSDEGYVLPPLRMQQHRVEVDITEGADGALFRNPSLSATSMHAEMRRTCDARAARVAELVATTPGPWLVWCHTNYEADALRACLPEAVEVRGDQSLEEKERHVADFVHGRTRVLLSKPAILGFGLNFQHCHQMAFVGLSYSYEALYQAIRRSWRFGQTSEVLCHLIAAETEGDVAAAVLAKARDHEAMKIEMVKAMRSHGLGHGLTERTALSFDRAEATGKVWTLRLGDCVELVRELASDSVDFCIHSPPFSSLYTYSDSYRDMGNSTDDAQFFAHYEFLLDELLRVTRPGRLMAIHCKQLVDYKGSAGRAGLRDFRGKVIQAAESVGWKYHSEVCIWTDPVLEMQRTKAHGLLYKQLRADSTFSRQGMAEYVCVFRKWSETEGETIAPVTHTAESFPLEMWQRYASPVWMDISRTDVLNVQMARDDKDEKHIAPLQLEVIRRAVTLWSNPGDLVLSPFAGIGSEGYVSLKLGRRFLGFELKPSYYADAQRHLRMAETEGEQQHLFGEEVVS
jgi:DNA modification methylase